MERWNGKIAVVTGASVGIGAAITASLVKHGVKVVGMARRVEKIEELKNELQGAEGELYPLKVDITVEEDVNNAFEWIKSNLGTIHILVNNAGFSNLEHLLEGEPQYWRQLLDVNIMGLCMCAQKTFQIMRDTDIDAGHIIIIGSMCGHILPDWGDPCLNLYPATKFAQTAIAKTIRQELLLFKLNIKITQISPGYVESEFFVRAERQEEVGDKLLGILHQHGGLHNQDVADAVIYALGTPPHVQILDIQMEPKSAFM